MSNSEDSESLFGKIFGEYFSPKDSLIELIMVSVTVALTSSWV